MDILYRLDWHSYEIAENTIYIGGLYRLVLGLIIDIYRIVLYTAFRGY